jgi:hypothetical protein
MQWPGLDGCEAPVGSHDTTRHARSFWRLLSDKRGFGSSRVPCRNHAAWCFTARTGQEKLVLKGKGYIILY